MKFTLSYTITSDGDTWERVVVYPTQAEVNIHITALSDLIGDGDHVTIRVTPE